MYLSVVSVTYLANIDRPKDVNRGAVRMKSALWPTWSNWCDSMVAMGTVGLQPC